MTGMTEGVRWLPLAIACAATSAAIYLNTLDCGFCFDDRSAIEENQDLRPISPWTNLIWDDFWGTPMNIEGSHKSYRPLCVLTFRLNYLLHELRPFGYHLVNVLLHCTVCFVFAWVCARVVFRGATLPVLIAGLCFAVHPVHVEAVAGVVGRAECLSALFYLLAFMAYRHSLEQSNGGVKWFLLSLLLCICSVLSKEQGITVIAICLCYEFFIVRKNTLQSSIRLVQDLAQCRPRPSWFLPLLVRTVGMMAFLGVVMFVRVKIMKAELPVFTIHDNPAVSLPSPFRQLHWLHLCFINAWVLLSPSFLCADWTMGTIPLIESLDDPRNLLTLAVFIVLVILGFHSLSGTTRDHQAILLALLLIIFPYIPASNLLFPVGFVVAERVLYVPSMGFAILVGLGANRLLRNKLLLVQWMTKSCIVFLLAMYCIKTLERNRDWYSDLSLFTSAIRINPHNGKIHNNVGHEYEHAGNLSYAEHMFKLAAEKQPDDIGAYINLGRVLKAQERYLEAEIVSACC